MAEESTNMKVKIKDARLAFAHVFEKDRFGRYSATLLMEPDSEGHKAVKEAITAVAKGMWKDKAAATLKALKAKDNLCLRDGETKADIDGFAGNYFLSATSKTKPTTVNRAREEIGADDDMLYSGCYPTAIVQVWAQDNPAQGWKRVNCQLKGLQHVREGERFGGGSVASKEEFDDLAMDDEEEFASGEGDLV